MDSKSDRFDWLFTSKDRSECFLSEVFKVQACPFPKKETLEIIKDFLNKCYDTRSVDILLLRYRDGLTYVKIAQLYGLTTSRIKQIEETTFSRVRRAVDDWKFMNDSASETSLDAFVKCLHSPSTSTRVYNALRNTGVKNVHDIISLGPTGLLRIRSIGKKTYEEIVDLLIKDYGERQGDWYISAIKRKGETSK